VLVEEIVAKTGRVQQQHPGGDVALGCTQLRLSIRVEAFDHLQLADLGDVGLGGRVEVKFALFDELQRRRAGDRLGGREDREHGVGRHVRVAVQPALASGTFVDVALGVGDHRHHAGHARLGRYDAVQDRVRRRLEVGRHLFSSL